MTDGSAGSDEEGWKPSALRVAVHELGHAAVRYFLSGHLSCILIYQQDGEYLGQTPAIGGQPAADSNTWQVGAACFYGGWAAVHLAIETGLLPREPSSVEATAGDQGFLGACPADEGMVDYAACLANPSDKAASKELAKSTAWCVLRDCRPTILELAERRAVKGFLDEDEQRAAFAPFRGASERPKARNERQLAVGVTEPPVRHAPQATASAACQRSIDKFPSRT